MVFNMGTFIMDHIFRDENGIPLGRVILKDDSAYKHNMDEIPVVLLKIPLSNITIQGLKGYIDGVLYEIPSDIPDLKVNKRTRDWIITNFFLRRVHDGETRE